MKKHAKFSKKDKAKIAALMRRYSISRGEAITMFVRSGL